MPPELAPTYRTYWVRVPASGVPCAPRALVVTPQVPGEDLATSAARAPPGVGMWYLPEKSVREQAVNNDLFK